MCGGDFLNKHPEEAMDLLNYVAETSKAWDEPIPREAEIQRPSSHQKGVMYAIPEDTKMKEKLSILNRRLDELEMKNQHEKQAVSELSASQPFCFNCQSNGHPEEHCQEHVLIRPKTPFQLKVYDVVTKGLFSNPRHQNHRTC